jgi:uncharacterized protein YndB with AHSA1/START domain
MASVAKSAMLIRRPPTDVFEAIVDPAVTTRFWFTKSTGRLDENEHVTWTWEMYGASAEVDVVAIDANERIVIRWPSYSGTPTTVEWTLTDRGDGTTYVVVVESGFTAGDMDIAEQAVESTQGFSFLLAGMKAWLEHELELGLVPDAHPGELIRGES